MGWSWVRGQRVESEAENRCLTQRSSANSVWTLQRRNIAYEATVLLDGKAVRHARKKIADRSL